MRPDRLFEAKSESHYSFFKIFFLGGGFFLSFVLYSALFHLPPLRFHSADGCWDRTQDRCNWCIGSQTLTTRLDLIRSLLTRHLFWSKIAIYLSLGLLIGQVSLQPSKDNIQHFKKWNLFTFLVGHFCLPGSGYGSGSTSTQHWNKFTFLTGINIF